MKKILSTLFLLSTIPLSYAQESMIVNIDPPEICSTAAKNNDYTTLENFFKEYDKKDAKKNSNGSVLAPMCMISVYEERNNLNIDDWKKAYPLSIYPVLLENHDLIERYFDARGTASIGQTSKKQTWTSQSILNVAANDLDNIKSKGATPYWYQIRLSGAFFQNDKTDYISLLKEATETYPNYIPIYLAGSLMEPKWGFSYKNLNDFALYGIKNSDLKEEIYTSIYRQKSNSNPCCVKDIKDAGLFDINIFNKGLYSILEKYPTERNYKIYTRAACLYQDKEVAKDLISNKLKSPLNSFLSTKETDDCLKLINN